MTAEKAPTSTLERGILASQNGDVPLARQLLVRATDENPDSELAWLWMAKVAPNMKEFEVCLTRAAEINPNNARTRVWLSEIRAQSVIRESEVRERSKWACPLCLQSYLVKPLKCARCKSVLTLADIGEFFDAEAGVRKELIETGILRIEADASNASTGSLVSTYRVLGLAHLNLGRHERALEFLGLASGLSPRDSDLAGAVSELRRRLSDAGQEPEIPELRDRSTVEFDARDYARSIVVRAQETPAQNGSATVPIAIRDLHTHAGVEEAPAASAAPYRPSILVVDDSPTIRKVLSSLLQRRGFNVVEARDGMESLAKIHGALPDLVILDVSMPDLDGYKVCKIIKDNELTSHIPVVFLTGKTGVLDRFRGKMAGGVEYVPKPVRPDVLLPLLERHLAHLVPRD